MKKNTNNATAAEIIANKFIEKLEQGTIPWVKPWELWKSWSGNTGNDYNGINMLTLSGGEYLTAKQIFAQGGKINKGAKAEQVVYYNETEKEVSEAKANELREKGYKVYEKDGKYINKYRSMHYYNVFSVDGNTDLNAKFDKGNTRHEHIANVDADKFIAEYSQRANIPIEYGSNRAFATHANTSITLPRKEQFKTSEEYYSTAFHEMIHTTSDAVKRDKSQYHKDDKARAREELVAEIGSAYLMAFMGMDGNKAFENSAAYVKGWAEHLKDDEKAILYAAPKAIEAANYIIEKVGA